MVDIFIYVFIILAIGIAIVAEILVAWQKYLMKKQFVEELNRKDKQQKDIENKSNA
jgi:C4-dicarboxylate transporter